MNDDLSPATPPGSPVPAVAPGALAAEAAAPGDPFGGHEFGYESHTDLFRCTRCRAYEVVARKDGAITQCPGDVPGESMVLNAW